MHLLGIPLPGFMMMQGKVLGKRRKRESANMHLVQILLPLFDNEGNRFDGEYFRAVRDELAARFGGVTVYSRAPAEGLWKDESAALQHDELILFDVMVEHLDREWWETYRRTLEARFRQDVVVVRAQDIAML